MLGLLDIVSEGVSELPNHVYLLTQKLKRVSIRKFRISFFVILADKILVKIGPTIKGERGLIINKNLTVLKPKY